MDGLAVLNVEDTVAWYENDGSEVFTKHVITSSVTDAFSVFAMDMDHDRDMDVLCASPNDDTVALFPVTAESLA